MTQIVEKPHELKFVIPFLAPSLNGNKGMMRMHFRSYTKIRNQWIQEVQLARQTWKRHWRRDMPLPGPVRLHIVRYYARQPLDLDNLYAACKVPIDALVKGGGSYKTIIPTPSMACRASRSR